jgi:hypothetical protein
MSKLALFFAGVVLSVVLGCSKGNGPQVCGTVTCSERQMCASAGASLCSCREEYTGNDCTSCARGYSSKDGKCVPVAINCTTAPTICGSHGTCEKGNTAVPDTCRCQTGYSGHTCQACADNYQDNDRDGDCTASCATTTCQGMQVCSDATGTARCACPGNRTGINCDQCPSGWTLREEVCVQTCASSGSSCGSRKTCDTTQGVCVCRPEYSGDTCDTCAAGYQDNDRNSTCTAACALTTCASGQVCADTTGTARCACPANRTGSNCEECLSGWVLRPSDGTCVQTCAAQSCGARRYCDETQGTPVCACQPGYTGSDCSTCSGGYTPDGSGQCYQAAPAGTTLLGAGRLQNGEYLLGINTTAGSAVPLRPLANLTSQRLTTNRATHTIYSVTASAIGVLNFSTGQVTPVATVQSMGSAAWGNGALYTLGTVNPFLLKRIDPSNGAVSDIGPTDLSVGQGSAALAWESGGTLLFARPATTYNNGADLFRIDPATAAVTTVGPVTVPGDGLRPADGRVSLAFDAGGKLFLATRLGRSAAEILADHCRKQAAGLGYAGYEAAPLTTAEINYNGLGAGVTRVLTSQHAAGTREIVAYASYGKRGIAKASLRLETTNPDTFVCLSSYEEVLELQVPAASARFTAVVLAGYRPQLFLTVEGSVPPVTQPTLHVHSPSGSVASEFSAYQFSRVYSGTMWNNLRLPTYASAWDNDAGAPAVLMEVNLATAAVTRVIPFPTLELYPSIDTWAP